MTAESTTHRSESPRFRLVRKAAVLQLKLIADGLRDAALIPISLIASVIGLIRGGDDADREYQAVIELGRRSERWINLFGNHAPLGRSHPARSLDTLIDRAEDVVREQYQKGLTTREARAAIEAALEKVQQATGQVSAAPTESKKADRDAPES